MLLQHLWLPLWRRIHCRQALLLSSIELLTLRRCHCWRRRLCYLQIVASRGAAAAASLLATLWIVRQSKRLHRQLWLTLH